jgi:hypothetical protein
MFALVLLALCLLFPPPPAFAQQPFITPSDVRLEVRTIELTPDAKKQLTAIVADNFEGLPLRTQFELLQSQWPALDHTPLLPLLERVERRYRDFPDPNMTVAMDFNRIGATALQRWYELAPREARTVVLEEITRPKPRFGNT